MPTAQASGRYVFARPGLVRNTSLNLVGQVIPVLVAFLSIPALIQRLGTERFGVLMLAWMCLGYFNLFDFGLSRALTKSVAEKFGTEAEGEIPVLLWTTVLSTAVFGLIGALTMGLSSSWLVTQVLKIPVALEPETRQALLIIAVCLPFVITATAFKGYLEATQSFGVINRIQVPIGALFYILPLVFAHYSVHMTAIVSALVICRLLAWTFFLRATIRMLPTEGERFKLRLELLPGLLKFGGWVTVANMIIPVISYADRFIIGALMSMTAVTYYSTPYEVVNRMWVIPWALISVVFPALASQVNTAPEKAARTFVQAIKLLFAILVPLTLIIILFAREGLSAWAGPELALKSAHTAQILALAIFFNSFGVIPSALLDAVGKPVISAISHLIQLPIYVAALYWFVPRYGFEGAAYIWVARTLFDTTTMFLFGERYFPIPKSDRNSLLKAMPVVGLITLAVFTTGVLTLGFRVSAFLVFAMVYVPWLWGSFFSKEDRTNAITTLFAGLRAAPFENETPRSLVREGVGIAMAVYKPELRYFSAQLASIQNQSHKEWICVISQDSVLDLDEPALGRFRADPRFIWVMNRQKAGVKSNFQNALREVLERNVDMVAFADQDDIWYPNKLERSISELRLCTGLGLVHSDMHVFTNDVELANKSNLLMAWENELRVVDGYLPLHFMIRNTVSGAGCLFDAEIGRIGLEIPDCVDFHDQWFAILASVVGEVRPIFEPLYAYRQHERNVVGLTKYEGFWYVPAGIGWLEGLQRSRLGWRRTRVIYETLSGMADLNRLPSIYRWTFRNRFLGGGVFLFSSFLYLKDDPTLSRMFFRKGVGHILS